MIKQASTKTSVPTPALIETYARLLVYTEIESLGIKGFLCKFNSLCLVYIVCEIIFCDFLVQLFPAVFKHQAWGILHILLEMFSYKMHHIPTHYRIQLLSNLHSLATMPQTNKMQLNLW